MNRLTKLFLICIVLFVLLCTVLIQYLSSGSTQPTNGVWESYIGRDTTVGILPDQYANYFTYTLARTNKNIGFRIKGQFPDTRYFSFNVYSLGDNTTQGSLVDYQIETDSGKPNPFVAHRDSVDIGDHYTVNILPDGGNYTDMKNLLTFRRDVRMLTMVIRIYDYNIDDLGGVDLPTVEAFNLQEGGDTIQLAERRLPRALNLRSIVRRVSLPGMVERLSSVYLTEKKETPDPSNDEDNQVKIPFHTINTDGYIANNDNRYLLAGITKQEDEVYVFRFKSPSYTTGPSDINKTQVRYWSFNLGNAASYNFNALKDEDAHLDAEGYVTIILADKDSEIEEIAKINGYNFMEWNMPWKKAFILFRHMLANPNFEVQIDDVPPIDAEMDDFSEIEAQKIMGDYAPLGVRMSKQEFIHKYKGQQHLVIDKQIK